jgi:lipoate-protein ligase A
MDDFRPYTRDDAMIDAVAADGRPRFRVYALDETAVVIGRGGKAELELDLAAIADDGVPVYRRRGGGCAVVVDPGNLVVSLALPLPGIAGITTAFAAISAALARVLERLGLPGVEQRGVSDLAVGGRKIGGSCVHRMRGLLYYSTTLLVDPDWDRITRYLPHPPREPEYRAGRRHREFLASLQELGAAGGVGAWQAGLQREMETEIVALQKDLELRIL